MRGASQQSINNFIFSSGCPATILLIAINVVTFFVTASMRGGPLESLLFRSDLLSSRPWALVTWPFIGVGHPISVVFGCLWAYWVCGSLERGWGTRTFSLFFLGVTALMSLSVWIGGLLLHQPAGLYGLFMALAAPTIAWCAVNRNEVIRIYGVLPVTAPLLAVLTLVVTWYEVGPPLLGLFGLTGCAAAYWYAMHGRYAFRGYASNRPYSASKGPNLRLHVVDEQRESVGGGFSPLRRFRAWQERRKLERLWKRSFTSDPSNKDR